MGQVDPEIVSKLQEMLNRENVLVGVFKQLRNRFIGLDPEPVRLRLLARTSDGHFENLLTENDYEFTGLAVDNDFANRRDWLPRIKRSACNTLVSCIHPSCRCSTFYYSHMGKMDIELILSTVMKIILKPGGIVQ